MTDFDRLEGLFAGALSQPPADRPAYLDAVCGDDPALRRRVDGLLAAHAAAGGFLAGPPPAGTVTADHTPPPTATGPDGGPATPRPPADAAGAVIAGRYKLLEPIGEGGMGTVWAARQTAPVKRAVAVKLVRADRGGSKTILARFAAERQAIALMGHPHIAKLLDAGTTEAGAPFFVMELVRGVPLTAFCDAHRLTVPDRLALFAQVCGAVQHAHQKGVIHRDLKPGNILVEDHDGKPVPKVIDFGLAKATAGLQLSDHTLYTGFGSVLGTPLYMAPEQATFSAVDIDTRADIYALGVILYELLTGSTPIAREVLRTAAFDEVLRAVREQDPPPPSSRIGTAGGPPAVAAARQTEPARLSRFVRGELDWIVMRALAKDRDRRYESAAGLARDIGRFLNREPVSAGPPTAAYRARKFVARNKGPVTAAGLVLLALVAGVIGTGLGLVEARRQADIARDERDDKEKALKEAVAERDEKEKARKEAEAAGGREAAQKGVAVGEAAAATEAKHFLRSVLVLGDPLWATPDRRADPNRTLREALDYASADVAGRFADRPTTAADLRATFGQAYLNLGAHEAAGPHLAAALALREGALGPGHPNTLRSVTDLAELHRQTGDTAAAERLFRRALAGWRTAPGPDRPEALGALTGLALVYLTRGDYGAAEPLLVRALAGAETAYGPDHPNTLTSLINLGGLYREAGDYAAAEPPLARALAGWEKAHGPDHPRTLRSASHLAAVYEGKGDRPAAEPLYVRALAGCEKVLGPDHPDALACADNLAGLYTRKGDHAAAERLFRRALAGWEKVYGPDHPDALICAHNLAGVCQSRGDPAEAERLYKRAVAGWDRARLPDHPGALRSAHNLGVLYREAGDHGAAEPPLARALAGWEKAHGPDHPLTLKAVDALALLYKSWGRFGAAEPLFRRAVAGWEKARGPDHPDTLGPVNNLATLYLDRGDFRAAEPLLRRAAAGLEKARGPDHPDARRAAANLGVLLARTGRQDEGLALLERANGRDDLDTLRAAKELAVARRKRGEDDAAERLFDWVLPGLAKLLGPDDPETLSCQNSLGVLYWQAGRLDESIPVFEGLVVRARAAGAPVAYLAGANLGVNYLDAGRPADALPLLEEAWREARRHPDPGRLRERLLDAYARAGRADRVAALVADSVAGARRAARDGPDLADRLAPLGLGLLNAGAFAPAEPVLRECLDLRADHRPDDWRTANTRSMLGGALLGQGKHAEAGPLLAAGYEGLKGREKDIPPESRAVRLAEAADRLVELSVRLKRPAEAERWRAERAHYPPPAAPRPRTVRRIAPPPRPAAR